MRKKEGRLTPADETNTDKVAHRGDPVKGNRLRRRPFPSSNLRRLQRAGVLRTFRARVRLEQAFARDPA